ncbi:ABC transporter substrate-binding protein [Cohnella herbarum]|uniref:Extracellular solute-binding protein n=1 Tax=Cohnella herbarum TaxID=2728023 RepID=A0A7Z2VH88_9BACL|nr:extracellular solute-binding protein [Cohnella herbarum]QJD82875.1 extracellular solute-binding protein [Cohnella herbarum]
MKKRMTLLMSATLLISMALSACGGNEAQNTATPNKNGSVESAPASASNDDAFTIRIGAWFIDDRPYMQEFKANTEKAYKAVYPNGTIQWDITLGDTYSDKLKAELASDTAPDVFFHQGQTAKFGEVGYLADLSGESWAGKLNPGTKSSYLYKDVVYSLPMGVASSGIWYNKKIFGDLGIQVPKSWSELEKAFSVIKAAGITPVSAGFKDIWTAQMTFNLWMQPYGNESSPTYGKDLYEGKKTLEGPEVQAVMTHLQEMVEKGYLNKTALSIDWPQSAELFTSGKAAMIVQGPWMPGTAKENFQTKGHAAFDLGYFPFTTDKGYAKLSIGVDQSLSVNAKTKLMQQAKDLVDVIASPEVYGPFNVGGGTVPAIQGMQLNYPDAALNDLLKVVEETDSGMGYESYLPASAMTSLVETFTKVASGIKFNPKDLAEAQKKLEKDKGTVIVPAE